MNHKLQNNTQGFSIVEGLLILVLVALIGGVGWYVVGQKNKDQAKSTTQTTSKKSKERPKIVTYKSTVAQGFSFNYPSDWKVIEDERIGAPNDQGVRLPSDDTFTIKNESNNISITFNSITLDNASAVDDKLACGDLNVARNCEIEFVYSVQPIVIPGLGSAYLVEHGKRFDENQPQSDNSYSPPSYREAVLHKPLSNDTIPKVGETKYPDYNIFYTLPYNKPYGRLSLKASFPNNLLSNLDDKDFWNDDIVKQAVAILETASFE